MNRNKIIFITVLVICVGSFVLASHYEYLDATLAAALIALLIGLLGVFQKILLSIFITPELKVELRTYPPDSHKTRLTVTANNAQIAFDTFYYRLNVENTGNVRAENVEVFLMEKYEMISNNFVKDNSFLPLNLRWSYSGEITKKSIAPNLFKNCDFGHINDPNYSHYQGGTRGSVCMVFDTEVLPNTGSFILIPGVYRFKVVVSADNVQSVIKTFEIDFKNSWTSNQNTMLTNNFLVKNVS